ncbi:protein NRT1/ PTR FAMILY 5.10-like isoform X1 [Juglans regia]|uniref:Protein NRT1/ PTR FAMILY 5.10-like isoform X1 n=2 Tax=Juglans regia TaxID=51240 RepID=A0A6P9DTF8_JUGRE|nr:protein NRT1/ PTR FAMILY 5.10-like isoform X1 [Juglans regia]
MDRTIFTGFEIPAASLQSLIGLAIVLTIPTYDRIFVPIARAITRKPSGITMLQRIGTGMLLSVICMVVAALVEKKRLETAQEYGLVDMPNVTIPMGILWLVPPYVLSGIADVFALVGLQEFFYDQVPIELRSVGVALYLSILGVGSFLSSFLVSAIEAATGGIDGQASWFADNVNRAHLDYFYWLLAGLKMAISTVDTPPLFHTVDGAVDFKGRPVLRYDSGRWRAASFIIGVEVAERFAYYGISCNLITYLTGPLGQSTATAAENVNAWSGTSQLLPLLGAFVADSFLGRYRTIVFASLIYILGLGLLSVSAMLSSTSTSDYVRIKTTLDSSHELQTILFFFSLYLVAIGQGGHKPCVQAFGADQFDGQDPEECKAKSSFFNWWYFGVCGAAAVTVLVLSYIQDNLSWSLGFGIPCIVMVVALGIFLLGTRTYRYSVKGHGKSPFLRIGRVFVNAVRNWRTSPSAIAIEEEALGILPHRSSGQCRFLNKALLSPHGSNEEGEVCTFSEVEEAKAILRIAPIWVTSLGYAIVFAQISTFFTKQGATMDRTIFPGFEIPAASLQCFVGLSIIILIPIYDRIFVPIARAFTRKPAGITMLQRIGTGMIFSIICMVVAALVEKKRLKTAQEYWPVNMPDATALMSVWWLVPQYVLSGTADVFTMVGLQEFFYDQVPMELRSVGLGLYLSILGVGSFLSSFLVSVIDEATGGDGQDSWFADNLNRAHLDYFYWLLAGINGAALAAFLYFARSYIYNRRVTI